VKKVYALVDCNSFYVSCERLFDPALKNKPIIVLSNNDGCAVALSKEAKSIGIRRGDPYFKIESKLKKAKGIAFSSNYSLYGDLSKRVMQVLEGTCPQMEVYSIDEAFLELSGLEHLGLDEYGRYIKDKVYREVGLPVSIGIARTKVLAKIANWHAKKSTKACGVLDLTDERFIDEALRRVPVDDIWGIGRRSGEKLKYLGIFNALQFRDYKNDKKILKLLTKVGRQIQDELRGINCFDLEMDTKDKDQIISSKSFGRGVSDKRELKEALANYVSRACEKMRRQNSKTRTIGIWLTTNPFSDTPQYFNKRSASLLSPSSDTRALIIKSFELLDEIFKEGFIYKKAGVMLSSLVEKDMSQLSFFEQGDNAKSIELMKVMDAINEREGSESIKSLACGIDPMWKTLCKKKSAHFTTRWSEILKINMDLDEKLKKSS
jgi:DNA polymerase V